MLRIGGKAIRGIKGSKNAKCEGFCNIDVTSESRVKLGTHSGKDFSPLTGNIKIFDNGREFQQFENWWQGNKVYKHLKHAVKRGTQWKTTKEFEKFQNKWANETKGKRVIPETKHNVGRTTPLFAVYDGQQYNYEQARWVYTAKYCNIVKKIPAFKELFKLYNTGEQIMLLDHDGPCSIEYPEGRSVTWELINNVFDDIIRPYGHAYIIAAMLLNTKNDHDASRFITIHDKSE